MLVAALLRLQEHLVVQGCPGVPMTMPRLDTVLQLRSSQLRTPFALKLVKVELRTKQTVVVSTKLGSLKNEAIHERKLVEQVVFTPPPGKKHVSNLLGVDIPLLMAIPQDTPALGYWPNWQLETVNYLHVEYTTNDGVGIQTFPISIKRYDNLPIYRQFTEGKTQTRMLANQQVVLELTLPNTCVGPMDILSANLAVRTNNQHSQLRKTRIKQMTLQIREVCSCHSGGMTPRREMKIATTTHQLDLVLNTVGVQHTFSVKFPRCNDLLNLYNMEPPRVTFDDMGEGVDNRVVARERLLDKLDEGISVTHAQGFTSGEGKLFRVNYELNVKLKLSGTKDVEERFPVVVLAFDTMSSQYLLGWIRHECEVAKAIFGNKAVVSAARGSNVLAGYNLPPVVYYNNVNDWVRMGYPQVAYTSDKGVDI